MPITYPSELIQIMSSHSGPAPVKLLDVVAYDGTSYHWADVEIDEINAIYTGAVPPWAGGPPPTGFGGPIGGSTFGGSVGPGTPPPPVIVEPSNYHAHYYPWLIGAKNFHFSRSMAVDTADFTVQNISGNSLQRDVAGILQASTFEGALFAYREWNRIARATEFEMHGRLTVTGGTEAHVDFGAEQLFNPSSYDGNAYEYSETCPLVYGGRQCGDTTNNPCSHTYTTCRVTNRFFGVLNNLTTNIQPTVANISTLTVERRRLV